MWIDAQRYALRRQHHSMRTIGSRHQTGIINLRLHAERSPSARALFRNRQGTELRTR